MTNLLDLIQHTQLDLNQAAFLSIRGSLFTGFLALGSFLLACFAFLSTRLHDFMKTDEARDQQAQVEMLAPGVEHTLPLRQSAYNTLWAVQLCFATACLQITVGLLGYSWSRWTCLLAAILTLAYVAFVTRKTLQVYLSWLRDHENEIAAQARKRPSSWPPLTRAS